MLVLLLDKPSLRQRSLQPTRKGRLYEKFSKSLEPNVWFDVSRFVRAPTLAPSPAPLWPPTTPCSGGARLFRLRTVSHAADADERAANKLPPLWRPAYFVAD